MSRANISCLLYFPHTHLHTCTHVHIRMHIHAHIHMHAHTYTRTHIVSRVELTVNLPKLEPFLPPTEEQEEPWSLNSTSSTSLRLGVKTRAEREKEGPPMAGEVPPHSSSILPSRLSVGVGEGVGEGGRQRS